MGDSLYRYFYLNSFHFCGLSCPTYQFSSRRTLALLTLPRTPFSCSHPNYWRRKSGQHSPSFYCSPSVFWASFLFSSHARFDYQGHLVLFCFTLPSPQFGRTVHLFPSSLLRCTCERSFSFHHSPTLVPRFSCKGFLFILQNCNKFGMNCLPSPLCCLLSFAWSPRSTFTSPRAPPRLWGILI